MSFLSSLSSSSPPTPSYHPASLSYLAIFSPSLKPEAISKEKKDELSEEELEQRNTSAQLLFYTSRERAVSNQKVSRQLGSATGAIQFAEMMAVEERKGKRNNSRDKSKDKDGKRFENGKAWSIHSSKRRLIMVEVMKDLWIHASIDLPRTGRSNPTPNTSSDPKSSSSTSSSSKTEKQKNQNQDKVKESEPEKEDKEKLKFDYHDEWLRDEWVEESLRRAWREWRLLNGSPSTLLSSQNGRKILERSLEKFFSVWVWSWDLEAGGNGSPSSHLNESSGRETFSETMSAIPVTPLSSNTKISDLITLFKTQAPADLLGPSLNDNEDHSVSSIDPPILNDLLVLQDTLLLYPATSASTSISNQFSSSDETSDSTSSTSAPLSPRDRVDLVGHIISHLSGLERERDLVRAAALASGGGGRRKGLSGGGGGGSGKDSKRHEKSGTHKHKSHGKSHSVSIRHGNANSPNNKRMIVEGSLKSNREKERENKLKEREENSKWSSWGGVWNSIGRGNFLASMSGGTDPSSLTSIRSQQQFPADPSTQNSNSNTVKESTSKREPQTEATKEGAEISAPTISASESLISSGDGKSKENTSSNLSQKLGFGDFIPLPDGTGAKRVWSGAEETFKGWGASLGLGGGKEEDSTKVDDNSKELSNQDVKASVPTAQKEEAQTQVEPQQAQVEAAQEAENSFSAERRDSHTAPDVDLSELAEAMNDRTPDQEGSQFNDQEEAKPIQEELKDLDTKASEVDKIAEVEDQATAIPQSKIATKSFPSLSVTSAAWYSSRVTKDNSSSSGSSSGKVGTASPAVTPSIPTTAGDELDADSQSLRESIKSSSTKIGGASNGSGGTKHQPILRDELLLLGHDHELDGWGDEEPLPFNRIKVYVGGDDEMRVEDSDVDGVNKPSQSIELEVLFTTRRLLTIVFVLSVKPSPSSTTTSDNQSQATIPGVSQQPAQNVIDMASSRLLLPSWNLLRRVQRLSNDEMRNLEKEIENNSENKIEKPKFLHFSPFESSVQDRLFASSHLMGMGVLAHSNANKSLSSLEDEADSEGQLLASREISKRHPYITESFSRSNNGRTWTVFSRSKNQTSTSSTPLKTNENLSFSHLSSPSVTSETYLLVAGSKPASMNDADHELRRLARDFPSFGL